MKRCRKFNQKFLVSQVKKAMRKLDFQKPLNMVFNPAAGLLAGKLGEERLIYYCVDEYTAFTGAAAGLKEIEEELFRRADLVVVSAEKLLTDKKKFNENTHIIRHGTDWRHFRTALDDATKIPDEIKNLPRPVIGFHGLLADWVDFELLKKTAEHFKNGSVVLIGKIAVDAGQKIKILNDVSNIHFLGRKPYEDLPAYCKGFDVALNPFAISDLTLAANPLKVREYLSRRFAGRFDRYSRSADFRALFDRRKSSGFYRENRICFSKIRNREKKSPIRSKPKVGKRKLTNCAGLWRKVKK